jgi:hypothetical protein
MNDFAGSLPMLAGQVDLILEFLGLSGALPGLTSTRTGIRPAGDGRQ